MNMLLRFWLINRPIAPLPLVRYIDGLETIETVGGFELLAPRRGPVVPAGDSAPEGGPENAGRGGGHP